MPPGKAKKGTPRTNAKRPSTTRLGQTSTGTADRTIEDHTVLDHIDGPEIPAGSSTHLENPDADQTTADSAREIAAMKAELEKERLQNAELRKRIENMPGNTNGLDASAKPIPRPKGTAGANFSIQQAMGLTGSIKKYETYKGIQRNLRDLAMNARINWEVPWAQVPSRDKAMLFEIARDQHPFLARFERDWATEEIVKQFVKNKRKNHYSHGWLDVPPKYAYLKQNAMKRNPTGSRLKRALAGTNAGAADEEL